MPQRRHRASDAATCGSVTGSVDRDGDGSEEADLDNSGEEDHSERILRQMRKCVLVHHQLSCLLIHRAALEAGIGDGPAENNVESSAADGCAALKQSISQLGGSTARLFSVALRDRHDLESMSETLQQRVSDMVQCTKGELKLVGCDSDSQIGSLAEQARSEGSVNLAQNSRDSDEVLSTPRQGVSHSASHRRTAELADECRTLASELASREVNVARLRAEIEETRAAGAESYQVLVTGCFDEVDRARIRNIELRELLVHLNARRVANAERSQLQLSAQAAADEAAAACAAVAAESAHRRDDGMPHSLKRGGAGASSAASIGGAKASVDTEAGTFSSGEAGTGRNDGRGSTRRSSGRHMSGYKEDPPTASSASAAAAPGAPTASTFQERHGRKEPVRSSRQQQQQQQHQQQQQQQELHQQRRQEEQQQQQVQLQEQREQQLRQWELQEQQQQQQLEQLEQQRQDEQHQLQLEQEQRELEEQHQLILHQRQREMEQQQQQHQQQQLIQQQSQSQQKSQHETAREASSRSRPQTARPNKLQESDASSALPPSLSIREELAMMRMELHAAKADISTDVVLQPASAPKRMAATVPASHRSPPGQAMNANELADTIFVPPENAVALDLEQAYGSSIGVAVADSLVSPASAGGSLNPTVWNESLARLDAQLRSSQSEFWGM